MSAPGDRHSGPRRLGPTEDERLFSVPHPTERRREFVSSDPWRVLRIMGEFVEGFDTLAGVHSGVTFFGSARTRPDDAHYRAATETARRFAGAGFSIITGGGPGIMEAANRGAAEAGAPSIGFNIGLPHEQEPNGYSTPDLTFLFHYFAVRKFHLVMRANALVVFPGGIGTLDELFEVLTLVQTSKMPRVPIVLIGRSYWSKVINFEWLVQEGMVDNLDLELFSYADDAEGTWQELLRLGLRFGPRPPGLPSLSI